MSLYILTALGVVTVFMIAVESLLKKLVDLIHAWHEVARAWRNRS